MLNGDSIKKWTLSLIQPYKTTSYKVKFAPIYIV